MSSASATAILMLHLPLLIEGIIATNNLGPTFECYITMCKIAQLMLSPVVSAAAVDELESEVVKHQKLYRACYGDVGFT